MINKTINISNKTVALAGAKMAIASVFAYSLIIMLCVIIRSSITIYNIMPNGERNNILLINSFSVAYSVTIFSVLMSIITALVGSITAVILKKLLINFNSQLIANKTILISCMTALTGITVIYFMLFIFLKIWMTFSYMETFSFWFLFPAIIYIGTCIIGGSKLNKVLNTSSVEFNNNNKQI